MIARLESSPGDGNLNTPSAKKLTYGRRLWKFRFDCRTRIIEILLIKIKPKVEIRTCIIPLPLSRVLRLQSFCFLAKKYTSHIETTTKTFSKHSIVRRIIVVEKDRKEIVFEQVSTKVVRHVYENHDFSLAQNRWAETRLSSSNWETERNGKEIKKIIIK